MAAKSSTKKAPAPETPATATLAQLDAALSLSVYRVIAPLRHNGTRYKVGGRVELDGADAARLIGLRVVVAADEG